MELLPGEVRRGRLGRFLGYCATHWPYICTIGLMWIDKIVDGLIERLTRR
jgi:hypothetical protein